MEGGGSQMAEAFGGVNSGNGGAEDGAGVPCDFGCWGESPDDCGGLLKGGWVCVPEGWRLSTLLVCSREGARLGMRARLRGG